MTDTSKQLLTDLAALLEAADARGESVFVMQSTGAPEAVYGRPCGSRRIAPFDVVREAEERRVTITFRTKGMQLHYGEVPLAFQEWLSFGAISE